MIQTRIIARSERLPCRICSSLVVGCPAPFRRINILRSRPHSCFALFRFLSIARESVSFSVIMRPRYLNSVTFSIGIPLTKKTHVLGSAAKARRSCFLALLWQVSIPVWFVDIWQNHPHSWHCGSSPSSSTTILSSGCRLRNCQRIKVPVFVT